MRILEACDMFTVVVLPDASVDCLTEGFWRYLFGFSTCLYSWWMGSYT